MPGSHREFPSGDPPRFAPCRTGRTAARTGAMWTMLIETTASKGANVSTSHVAALASRGSGNRTFVSALNLIQLAVLAREAPSGSVGSQLSPGIASAKYTACSPVPQPISSTLPRSSRLKTFRIGSAFRAAEGEFMRRSASSTRCSRATGRDFSVSLCMWCESAQTSHRASG